MDWQTVLVGVLVLGVLLIARTLRRSNKSRTSLIDLEDLLLGDDGKASKAAVVMFGAFFLSTWIMINLTLTGKLTDVFFAAYLTAWVAPTLTKLLSNKPPPEGST